MNNFGELYRTIRKNKGIQLKEVAEGIMSPQAVSKFERGDSNITVSNLLLLLDKINVSYEEFFERSNIETLSAIMKTFELEMDWAASENVYFEWQKIIKKYEALWKKTQRNCYRHFSLVAQYNYVKMNDIKNSSPETEVINYLLHTESWGDYELFLVNFIMSTIQSDLLNLKIDYVIRKKIIDETNSYQLLDFFMVTAGTFFKRSEYDNFIRLVDLIESNIHPKKVATNLFFLLFIDYLSHVKKQILGDAMGYIRCNEILDFLIEIGLQGYANILYKTFQKDFVPLT